MFMGKVPFFNLSFLYYKRIITTYTMIRYFFKCISNIYNIFIFIISVLIFYLHNKSRNFLAILAYGQLLP